MPMTFGEFSEANRAGAKARKDSITSYLWGPRT